MKSPLPLPSPSISEATWRVWVDTGGTFTDCLAFDPQGQLHRAKVLSSSALRGRIEERLGPNRCRLSFPSPLVDHFADGTKLYRLDAEDSSSRLVVRQESGGTFELDGPFDVPIGAAVELRFDLEAPILAACLVTATPAGGSLPAMELRLATTRGTNALLERRGAKTVLFITKGFSDLLRIGDQARPDLFALNIQRSKPLYQRVVAIEERLDASGSVVRPLQMVGDLEESLESLEAEDFESAAIVFMHSYLNASHEQQLAQRLVERGWKHVTSSAALAPLIKILPRAQTAVVDAYLAPIIGRYLERVASCLDPPSRLLVMTSAGGLVDRSDYHAKDSLLSGPAGGVVGASQSGKELAVERLIAFDMGGTSTDVSRIEKDYEYVFQHRVGDALVAAPALAIETVAAGGGSICWLDGQQAKVGPESGGAQPGPACYGAGGPLTLTDVHLLLGRLAAHRFRIPIQPEASKEALDKVLAAAGNVDPDAFLQGFLDIANERMADAVRRISVRQGYDPRDYALLAFGGAGGLHACGVADLLGIRRVLLPRHAGLLSAVGLGAAVIERFAQRQVLDPLDECVEVLPGMVSDLAHQAMAAVEKQGVPVSEIRLRRRLLFLRFKGQESSLEIDLDHGVESQAASDLEAAFRKRYRALYGYEPEGRDVEVESLRVVASSPPPTCTPCDWPRVERQISPTEHGRGYFEQTWQSLPIVLNEELKAGDSWQGPALLLDDFATLVVEPGWTATVASNGTVVVVREGP